MVDHRVGKIGPKSQRLFVFHFSFGEFGLCAEKQAKTIMQIRTVSTRGQRGLHYFNSFRNLPQINLEGCKCCCCFRKISTRSEGLLQEGKSFFAPIVIDEGTGMKEKINRV